MPPEEACPACGGQLWKLGEDVSEMLESIPVSFRGILPRTSFGPEAMRAGMEVLFVWLQHHSELVAPNHRYYGDATPSCTACRPLMFSLPASALPSLLRASLTRSHQTGRGLSMISEAVEVRRAILPPCPSLSTCARPCELRSRPRAFCRRLPRFRLSHGDNAGHVPW
jgi:hypothetical protein